MDFMPSFKVNSVVSSKDFIREFQCSNMGGMRRSKRSNTLVIISDETKGLYKDLWHGNILNYTGMGKVGDQSINYRQNKVLANSNINNVKLHLFEVKEPRKYIYRGPVILCQQPYIDHQLDENGDSRRVWIFPLCLDCDATSDMKLDYYSQIIREEPEKKILTKKKQKNTLKNQ